MSLLREDSSGLLLAGRGKPQSADKNSLSVLDRHIREIINFFEKSGRAPEVDSPSMVEIELASRLQSIVDSPELLERAKDMASRGNFKIDFGPFSKEAGFSDPTNNDLLRFDDPAGILNLQHVRHSGRLNPNNMAHRTKCSEFHLYSAGFSEVLGDLESNTRHLVEFAEDELVPGTYFVLAGILGMLVELDTVVTRRDFPSGSAVREDGPTLCVFSNGTQSKMLYRSLVKALQVNGFLVSPKRDSAGSAKIGREDESSGYVYVLKSKNDNFAHIGDLHKIGFTSGLVDVRLSGAESQSTYLFSGVEVVATYKCFNVNAKEIEQQLHSTFSSFRFDIEIKGPSGSISKPKEWFKVPLTLIDAAMQLLQEGRLDQFQYVDKVGFVERATAKSEKEMPLD
jgi:hypothetical protein